jgi:hypothetical protein
MGCDFLLIDWIRTKFTKNFILECPKAEKKGLIQFV